VKVSQNRLQLSFQDEDGELHETTAVLNLQPNEWVHLGVVLEGTVARFYANGVSVGTGLVMARAPMMVRNANSFGAAKSFAASFDAEFALDEVKIFDRVLSPHEVYIDHTQPEYVL
jgi:hypothetical protein